MPKVRKHLYRGTPGHPYSQEKVDLALAVLRERRSRTDRRHKTFSESAKVAGVIDPNTVSRWAKKDMTPEARAARLKGRGHNKLFDAETELQIAGWVILRNELEAHTTIRGFKYFVSRYFQKEVSQGWVYDFMERQHISARKVEATKHVLLTERKRQEGIDFLNDLRQRAIPADHIIVMDKTKLATLGEAAKELGPKGR